MQCGEPHGFMEFSFPEMVTIPNLLLIAGTGNKSGKTTFACRVIEEFRETDVTGIKITPHFHETTPGLNLLSETTGYSLYEETDPETGKDTSRMLRAGAGKVYFAKVTDGDLKEAFLELIKLIPPGTPVVCESPGLRHQVEPGLFVIMKSDDSFNNKNINELLRFPHVMIHLDELQDMKKVPVGIENNKWYYRG